MKDTCPHQLRILHFSQNFWEYLRLILFNVTIFCRQDTPLFMRVGKKNNSCNGTDSKGDTLTIWVNRMSNVDNWVFLKGITLLVWVRHKLHYPFECFYIWCLPAEAFSQNYIVCFYYAPLCWGRNRMESIDSAWWFVFSFLRTIIVVRLLIKQWK